MLTANAGILKSIVLFPVPTVCLHWLPSDFPSHGFSARLLMGEVWVVAHPDKQVWTDFDFYNHYQRTFIIPGGIRRPGITSLMLI